MSALVNQRNGRGEGPGGWPDDGSDDRLLGRLLDAAMDTEPLWRPEDLGDIWRHQLTTPAGPAFSRGGHGPPPATFGDVLRDPSPAVAALERVKQLSRAYRSDPDPPVPPEVATALYFAAIAAALVRCGRRITSASDELLRDGMRWAAAHPWLDEATRGLLDAALQRLPVPSATVGDDSGDDSGPAAGR